MDTFGDDEFLIPTMITALRRTLLLIALSVPLLAAGPAAGPNIVLILADDLGYGDLGCYGQREIQTPHIDALARAGVRFTRAYAGSTVCAPSRCALLTGQHTGHAQVRANTTTPPEGQQPLRPDTPTIARLLQQAGYATGAFGKWGLGGPDSTGEPAQQGFDRFLGYLCQALAHEYYPTTLRSHSEAIALDGATYSHDRIEAEMLAFIRANRSRPFFCYGAVTLPHGKLQVPSLGVYAQKPWPLEIRTYAAMVARLDETVGKVVSLLREFDLARNTLIIVASDNGAEPYYMRKQGGESLAAMWRETLGSHGGLRGYKRDLFEGGIRVPVIAAWPGHTPANTVCDAPWAFWDLLPTFAEIAGRSVPADTDGGSILPLLEGRSRVSPEYFYWEFHERGFHQAVLHHGRWKAIRSPADSPLRLYDLLNDESESHDVAAIHPAHIAKIETYLRTARTPLAASATPARHKNN